ncbi:canalicular multispecific organic anion transporter 1 [Nannizzia gypsea CBS 118893]|uniref:Canalicular multispecific organic anion transporter 1 n=1 Tax=Arthroderma gypseum (strain ATCC MYA-4604 / CBS 118893) TaxID=535722 RepID=E4UP77_ARTGP|nr:canalicular multispecific organic anion transporter 1 [Nannizzia gypsea CBS 118893]EFQ99803.1 canalicular multispecific organic anion transporter 1 [Nannizzia gypsea CBS 118893]
MADYSVRRVQNISIAIGIAGSCLTAVTSIPAIRAVIARYQLKKENDLYQSLCRLYQDEDGSATELSSEVFSDRFQRTLIALLSLTGILASLAIAVSDSDSYGAHGQPIILQWLIFTIWGLLLIQATALAVEPFSTKRYELGLCKAASCGFLLVILCGQLWSTKSVKGWQHLVSPRGILLLAQLAAGFINCCASVSLPRRPEVYLEGKAVDQQFTGAFFGRVSFSWAGPLLKFAIKNQTLEIDDLPALDYATRSKSLRDVFDKARRPGEKLWRTLVRVYAYTLISQALLVTCTSTLSFAPQYCLLRILRSLEGRNSVSWHPMDAWVWVFALGGSILLSTTVESWLYWVAQYQLGIPVYEQLSAVVFAKAMRRKDVKGAQKANGQPQLGGKQGHPQVPLEEDSEDDRKTRQDAINHIAVDATRVADCASYNCIIILIIVKLTITIVFLSGLIGWRALGAGLLVSVIITPLNIYTARRYNSSQTTLMGHRDRKMGVVAEALQGIRQIKFSALERQWEQKIYAVREAELSSQWQAFICEILLVTIWIIGPVMLSAVSLGVYTILHGSLSPSVAFTTISVFTAIEFSLAVLPELIADCIEGIVSTGRIGKYLESAERVQTTIPGEHISFEKSTVAWPAENLDYRLERFMLQDLNINFPSKGLSVISGKTGSGKSLLLAAILGEADILEGIVRVPVPPPLEDRFDSKATKANWIIDSATAYVAQVPWIENASIKENILFGLPLDTERYQKVIFACALEKDFEMLPDGELTDIGANGINLSGGQKWRISFARALYSRAGILVMDDIFSALDAHTGRHLHVHALTGELSVGRTRILVTHHVGLCLPQADYAVHLEHGVIKYAGTPAELQRTGNLSEILAEEDIKEAAITPSLPKALHEPPSEERSATAQDGSQRPMKEPPKKFQQEEGREIGAVKLINYVKYLQNGGGLSFWTVVMFLFTLFAILGVVRSWWVSIWTRSVEDMAERKLDIMFHITNRILTPKESSSDNIWFYLGIYVALSVLSCVIGSLRYVAFLYSCIQASRNIFKKLTHTILRAPLRWLDTVPLGRIINRFTSDFNQIDSKLPYDLSGMIQNILQILGIIAAGVLVSPFLFIFAVVLLLLCFHFSNLFLQGAREIKRLESNAKSPIFEQFGSALIGLGTIRAFSRGQTYIERMYALIDRHAQAYWNLWLFNRWLGFRMGVIGAAFASATAAFIVSLSSIDASLAGFALSFALQYTSTVTWMLRQYANVELAMNSVERVFEYSDLEIENQDGLDAPAAWPTDGRLEVSDLVVAYAPELPPVLKGLSFTVEKNQRVGVVGRTGAGKSSLTLALFRFLEAREGSICIDGIDVSKIKLAHLRSRLAIIPQDPVLFSGTIRSNLDPFDEYSDAELQSALERVHLTPPADQMSSISAVEVSVTPAESGVSTPTAVESSASSTLASRAGANINIFKNLNSRISEGGLNLSQGQRQLLCLARAIVSRPKIMVLDEATSAVDMDTDALTQQSIRSEFGRNSTTLLVIAHRLSTIADFDRILVLDAGKAVEFGAPRDLMNIENGVFKGLVQNSGEREMVESIIMG